MDEEDSSVRKFTRGYAQAGPYISIGLQFSLSILLCLFLGWWADEKLDTSPLLLVVGTFLGAAAGFYNLYRALITRGKNDEKERERTD